MWEICFKVNSKDTGTTPTTPNGIGTLSSLYSTCKRSVKETLLVKQEELIKLWRNNTNIYKCICNVRQEDETKNKMKLNTMRECLLNKLSQHPYTGTNFKQNAYL